MRLSTYIIDADTLTVNCQSKLRSLLLPSPCNTMDMCGKKSSLKPCGIMR